MNRLTNIQTFLEPKEMAITGVSRNPKKFGRMVYDHLLKRGFKIHPVNPHMDQIDGKKCYRDVSSLPEHIDRLYIVTPADQTARIIQDAVDRGISHIWIQQQSENDEAVRIARENSINLIYKDCMMKFAEPVTGVHAFHRFFNKLFGTYPK